MTDETGKTSRSETAVEGRRGFLRMMGFGAVSAGAAAVAGATSVEAAEKAAIEKGDYRETEHVKTYYQLARF